MEKRNVFLPMKTESKLGGSLSFMKLIYRIRRLGRCIIYSIIQPFRFILNHPTDKQIKDSLHITSAIKSKMVFIQIPLKTFFATFVMDSTQP